MEASEHPANVLTFIDGPASEERVCTLVPPGPTRWYCQGVEMGSDQKMSWWTMEEPPADPSVEITRYELIDEDRGVLESGDILFRYEMAVEAPEASDGPGGAPWVEEQLKALADQREDPQISHAHFHERDIRGLLVGGEWLNFHEAPVMSETLIETDDEGPVKLSVGPCFSVMEAGSSERILIPPTAVQAFRVAEASSVASEPEHSDDGKIVRMNRRLWDTRPEPELDALIQQADRVVVIEANGRETIVKDREPESDEPTGEDS